MKRKIHNWKKSVLAIGILGALLISQSVAHAGALWEFKVPIILHNIPKDVTHVCVHWYLYADELVELTNKKVFLPVKPNANGDVTTSITITINESDLTPSQIKDARTCFFTLELSDDGVNAYKPNDPTRSWTQSKPGTKLVKGVFVVKLQGTLENHPWKA